MIRTVLVGVANDFEQKFAEATANEYVALDRPAGAGVDGLRAELRGLPSPDVIVLDARANPDETLEHARELTVDYPLALLLIAEDPDRMGLAAMRAGVRDLIPSSATPMEVRRALDTIAPIAAKRIVGWEQTPVQPAAPKPPGSVITFTSPKGGVGKTVTSTNLAVGLAQQLPHSTVLVDLDLQFGDVATALNISSEFSVADAVKGPASRDTIVLKTYLAHHDSGLYVLPAPENPADADSITGDQITHLLEMLATEFRFVVVDTSPGLSEHTLGALDHTTDLVLLTTLSVTGVRGLRKVIDTLNALRMFGNRRHVVINFADSGGGLSKADVEATLEAPVSATLPTSKGVLASINMGVPLMQTSKRDPLAKALRSFSGTFLPEQKQRKQRRR